MNSTYDPDSFAVPILFIFMASNDGSVEITLQVEIDEVGGDELVNANVFSSVILNGTFYNTISGTIDVEPFPPGFPDQTNRAKVNATFSMVCEQPITMQQITVSDGSFSMHTYSD